MVRLRRRYPRTCRVGLVCLLLVLFFLFRSLFFTPSVNPTRIVFSADDLKRIWEWEVRSGHYQSRRKIPDAIVLDAPLHNPGLPQDIYSPHDRITTRTTPQTILGSGLRRNYIDLHNDNPTNVAYPPRPKRGSIADLDIIMEHCDFSNNKYVRDCLEILSVGAGLDNGRRLRRGTFDEWKYIYVEEGHGLTVAEAPPPVPTKKIPTKQDRDIEPPLQLSPPRTYWTSSELEHACDPEHPRIFHIFWGGNFTAHPFTTILSFLFTQNLGLHLPSDAPINFCRPQFWVWMQMGRARDAKPKENALKEMEEHLRTNPWSQPFLHPRFKDIIKFKLWNTTEQLDNVKELRDEWRLLNLFNSGGHIYHVPPDIDNANASATSSWAKSKQDDDVLNRVGSTSAKTYDRMRTILSDMARFVLCHRFGGIYLDADTILLRDWEELWGWKGAFAYRWSRKPEYNTAVLKLNKGSALGSFIIRTALRHGLDFHPITAISQYTKDAHLEQLLLRLPDALFDPPWLNTENFQRERPPTPGFTHFDQFFNTPRSMTGDAMSLGFEGFFRGAFSYHWHNNWWRPYDPARNWPDLGPRFADAERQGRIEAVQAAARLSSSFSNTNAKAKREENPEWHDRVSDDKQDLDWSTILKRTFEAYIRGERPNMYGEWIRWS